MSIIGHRTAEEKHEQFKHNVTRSSAIAERPLNISLSHSRSFKVILNDTLV